MEILKKENKYSGFLKLDELEIRLPNNEIISREVIKKKNSVCIVPVTKDGRIYLTKQPRAGRNVIDSIEIPAGLIEEDDDNFEMTARRELLEETGCVSGKMIELMTFFSDPACCTSETHLFLALDVKQVQKQKLDFDEFLTVFDISIEEAYQLLEQGKIKDVNSIIGLLKSKNYILDYITKKDEK